MNFKNVTFDLLRELHFIELYRKINLDIYH
jgi:hypothetical protein